MASGAGSTVLEVGPGTVRVLVGGTGRPASPALVAAALDWIDDPVGLLEGSPVAVADLWFELMAAIIGRDCDSVVVVHPPDWPAPRVGRALAAANAFADRVVAVSRNEWTPAGPGTDPGGDREAGPPEPTPGPRCNGRRLLALPGLPGRSALLAPILAAALAVLGGFGVFGMPRPGPEPAAPEPTAPEPAAPEPTALVEGRVVVRVPPDWTIQRITGGPGSRRVQVNSPSQPGVALHITQSYAPGTTLADAADLIGRAIAGQPAGVFVDLRAADNVAGRSAVTYQEVRPGRVIRWTVLPAGAVRIGIGCQSPPAGEDAVRAACAEAVRSARALGTETGR